MKIVWDLGAVTVRDVYEKLRARRQIAYTTVLTMIKILEQKQFLKRVGGERAYIYQATRPREQVIRGIVQDFLRRVFDGSAQALLVHLVRDGQVSEQDLKKIARALREER